jgi:hypothetical protein
MTSNQTISLAAPVTQPWNAEDTATLEEFAWAHPTQIELAEAFPDRTPAAIRQQLFKTRRRLGVPKQERELPTQPDDDFAMLKPDDPGEWSDWHINWRRKAEAANQRFMSAMLQAA